MANTDEIGSKTAKLAPGRSRWARLLDQIGRSTRRADAEDLLQDAYCSLLSRASLPDNQEAFLVRAAVNKGRDAWRRERVRGADGSEEAFADLADGSPPQDEVLIMRQRLARVREGVARLTPRTREVFLLQRVEGCSYREIAERLAISQSAVEKHMARAMTHLAEWTETW
ncbi:sigma-70 family RNA polymerase sigma factor [Sphingomonadaceae bacterium jetA1]|jgi:RNA polymerase sigma-70 factor (ECF subfamily)|uniref:RNA polymerase sigma factor n=1 Tax=Facivitalis istanbulensis TaxID=3075838 RepID=UPI00347EAD83